MTDNEIIKAAECCVFGESCEGCPLEFKDCANIDVSKLTLDLINRQKAEIERLNDNLINKCIYLSDDETTEYCVNGPCPKFKTEAQITAEAVKKFAKFLVDKAENGVIAIVDLPDYVREKAGKG
mgnify:CR=1 FL=1